MSCKLTMSSTWHNVIVIGGGAPDVGPTAGRGSCSAWAEGFFPGWWARWARKSHEGFFRSTKALKPPGESLNVWEAMVPQGRRTHRKIQPEADFVDMFDVISEQFRVGLFYFLSSSPYIIHRDNVALNTTSPEPPLLGFRGRIT